MKIIFAFIVLISLSTLFFYPKSALAALDTCYQHEYCDKASGTERWVKKYDCVRDPEAERKICPPGLGQSGFGECDIYQDKICNCKYEVVYPNCINPGGIPDSKNAIDQVFGRIKLPTQIERIGFGADGISNFLSWIIQLIYLVAGIAFLFMIVWGAFSWIISGGDKDNVKKARDRITHAIIGIILLALAFVILRFIGDLTGFKFFV